MDSKPLVFAYRDSTLRYNRIAINPGTERSVEIPLGFDFLYRNRHRERLLEVGNVLSYYENHLSDLLGLGRRRIIDKFEKAMGVENLDLMDLQESYDAILSISTLEHVGQAEDPSSTYGESIQRQDQEAPLRALVKVWESLNPEGRALITIPFGKLIDGVWYIQWSQKYYNRIFTVYGLPQEDFRLSVLKRMEMEYGPENPHQVWKQVDDTEVDSVEYNSPWPAANAIGVIEIGKTGATQEPVPTSSTSSPLHFHSPVLIGGLQQPGFVHVISPDQNGIFHTERSGCVFHGPYMRLPSGTYAIEARFQAEDGAWFRFDMAANIGETILFQKEFHGKSLVSAQVRISEEDHKKIELRLFKIDDRKASVAIPLLVLRQIEPCK